MIISLKKLEFTFKNNVLWRELKLPVISSTHLLEDHILNQMSSIEGGIADKTKYRIKRNHQVGKRLKRRYYCIANIFTQSQ